MASCIAGDRRTLHAATSAAGISTQQGVPTGGGAQDCEVLSVEVEVDMVCLAVDWVDVGCVYFVW